MTTTQKVILIALAAVGAICLIVGLTLSHYIGGFLRTVEEEAREREEEDAGTKGKAGPDDQRTT